jgi:acylphosphatase
MALKALQAVVEGMVQGVGFRYATIRQARAIGLTGFVRNLDDGRVEVVAEGEEAGLQRLEAWLRRGPSGAYVRAVDSRYEPYRGIYREFTLRY